VLGWIGGAIKRLGMRVEKGAETPIHVCSAPELEGVTGQYFDKCKPTKTSPLSYDEAAQERLWQVSERLTGISP
jgi:hypothetical protein